MPPREAPTAPGAPLERLAPARTEPEIAAPAVVPPRAAPVAPAPIERLAPANVGREIAPPTALPAPGAQPRATSTVPSGLPQAPAAEPQMPQRTGPPNANEDIFKPRRDVGAPPGDGPHIDLDAARKKAAREIVSEGSGSRGVFTVPPPPERKSKAASALEKAIKPDCRTAYADMGLLAAPVLIASAIAADGSCRW